MKTCDAKRILLAAILTSTLASAGFAAEEIKGGKWQFTTEMQLPATMQPPPASQTSQGGGPGMTRTACISSASPVPADTQQGNIQCNIDKVERNGSVVTWSMICNSPRGPIHSAGAARYSGDTMEATLTARIPGPSGQPVDAPGRITGHYLGPCDGK